MIVRNIPNTNGMAWFLKFFLVRKTMVPTSKKNYSILSTAFTVLKIFFEDFWEPLFSPFTKKFARVVSKEIKRFLYQSVWYKKVVNFWQIFPKKINKIDFRKLHYTLYIQCEGRHPSYIRWLKHFILHHQAMLVMTLWQDGLCVLSQWRIQGKSK